MKIGKNIKTIAVVLGVLAIILASLMPPLEAARLVFGGFYVIILPGLLLTYALFENNELDFVERLPFAFGFSLVIVSLLVFNLGQIGMWISAWSILGVITVLNVVAIGIILKKHST